MPTFARLHEIRALPTLYHRGINNVKNAVIELGVHGRLSRLLGNAHGLRGRLTRGAIGGFGLKIVATLLSLAVSVVLARGLAPEGLGIYAFALSIATLLALPAQLGLATLMVRQVARYHQSEQWSLMRGILRWANAMVVALSLTIVAIAGLLTWWVADGMHTVQLAAFAWALLLVPLLALSALRQGALRGLGRVVLGQLPESLILPGAFLALLGLAWFASELNPPTAMALNAVAAALSFGLGAFMLLHARPAQLQSVPVRYELRTWFASVVPLTMLAGLGVIKGQTGILMLGLLADAEHVGHYKVAYSTAGFVAFALSVIGNVVAPHIARLHKEGDKVRLQRMLTQSARVTLLTSLPVALIFVFFSVPVLDVLFGEAFRPASAAFAILCVGQLVNAGVGSAALILNMTGYERLSLRNVAIATAINIALNAMLIPLFDIVGAAIAMSTALVCMNLLLCHSVWRYLGINSTAIRFKWFETWRFAKK